MSVLSDPHREQSDIRLVNRAVRNRWKVDEANREKIVTRLMEIVEKREASVMTKGGPCALDGPADTNANAAARVLVAMEQQNQADEHLADKNDRLDAGKATERVVESIEVVTPMVRRIQSRVAGAAEITSDGFAVSEGVGEVPPSRRVDPPA